MGELNPGVGEIFDLTGKVFLFELNFQVIVARMTERRTFTPLPRFPAVTAIWLWSWMNRWLPGYPSDALEGQRWVDQGNPALRSIPGNPVPPAGRAWLSAWSIRRKTGP